MKKLNQLAIEITYAQSKDIDYSVDDWRKKLKSLLKAEEINNNNTLKKELNKIFSKNPDFVFYDHENECIGKDLLDLISKLLKAQELVIADKNYDLGVSHYKQHIKDKIEKIKIDSDEEFEKISGFRSETCSADIIYNQALKDIIKEIKGN